MTLFKQSHEGVETTKLENKINGLITNLGNCQILSNMARMSTHPLTDMSNRNLPEDQRQPGRKSDYLPAL